MHISSIMTLLVNKLFTSRSLRVAIAIIGLAAAYLQFRDAGATPLFWGFVLATRTCAILVLVPILRQVIKMRHRRIHRESSESTWKSQRLRALTALIDEFEGVEKSKALSKRIDQHSPIRVLTIRSAPPRLGVILNIGSSENVQVGTQLVVFRTDERTPGGEDVERPMALVEVTYVQVANNCSQAVVVRELDEDFWNQARGELLNSSSLTPPRNFAIPHIPRELEGISLEDMAVLRTYLQRIRYHLAMGG